MIRLGIICPAEIAYRRFLPAIKSLSSEISFVGVAVPFESERFEKIPTLKEVTEVMQVERQKAENIIKNFGGKIFNGYKTIISSSEIDALYIPLPPSLHYKWAKEALENGKHVLVEKPSTLCLRDSADLIEIAAKNKLALHENYMFVFHNQIKAIQSVIDGGEIGKVRLYRVNFGFPKRASNDFRYIKDLGGGALFDAGGYTLKYANILLNGEAEVVYGSLNYESPYDVDLYGSGAVCDKKGNVVQIAFGMDNEYKCELEIWGSKGTLYTGRVLTSPVDYEVKIEIRKNGFTEIKKVAPDDSFAKSIEFFINCIDNADMRRYGYNQISLQARLLEEFLSKSKESYDKHGECRK